MASEIGFIGIGALGAPIARKLMAAGHKIVAFDTDPDRQAAIATAGAALGKSPRDIADRAALIFACLPSPEISNMVAAEIADGTAIELLVELSTLGVPAVQAIAARLAERDIALLDSPVVGGAGGSAVEAGNIAAIVAGPHAAFERAHPMLADLTRKIFYVGEEHGQAQICKMVNNAIGITSFTVACEAMAMGAKAGIDPRILLDIVYAGSGRCVATEDKFFRSVLPRKLGERGSVDIGLKDISLYVETLQQMGLPTRIGAIIMDIWQGAKNEDPARGYSSIIEIFERDAGIEVKG
jgi:3-hydroxyisobutyrate dehydrogenase-like beta-hydroxyacid dehydrogenase